MVSLAGSRINGTEWQHSYFRLLLCLPILIVLIGLTYSSTGPELYSFADKIGDPPSAIATQVCNTVTLPPQGLYESCMPADASCLDQLSEMGARGFKVVMNDGLEWADTAASIRGYADRAYQLGMKIILPVKYFPDWDKDASFLVKQFPNLAAEGRAGNNKEFITYYVNILKNHPALWGYYMADEVHSEYHDGLKVYSDLVKSLDPSHPRLIVEEGSNDPMEIFYTFHSYMKDTVDVLGVDYYPYGYIDTFSSITRFTGASARNTQYWADKLSLKHVLVLQAYAMPQYYGLTDPMCKLWPVCAPFPNSDQMKAQRDQTLLNAHPEMILWFSYPDILRSDRPAQHWNDLVAAAFAPPPCAAASPTPRPQNCPSGWNCEDIGNPRLEGTQSLASGQLTIEGSGWDIGTKWFERADQFRYVWQEQAGNGEFSARIVNQTKSNASPKAGIMLRKTYDPVSPYYAVLALTNNTLRIQYRSEFNQNHKVLASLYHDLPIYVKVARNDSSFSAYYSTDGDEWVLINNSTLNLPVLKGSLLAGLAVTSQNESTLNSAKFEAITVLK